MPTYIGLLRFTQKGSENIKEFPARFDTARQAFKAHGGEVKAFYVTMGQYDAIAVVEAPNDETMAHIALTVAATGNIHTEHLRAFTEPEYKKIFAGLP
ncbi:MAG TPA: GYD domain-containing protein [Candidatus Methylomirabilis sp.]|nr:GYD domain-containing protein [Candidatus Methylomirabilis sp.]